MVLADILPITYQALSPCPYGVRPPTLWYQNLHPNPAPLRRELAVEQAADMPVYRATFGTARPGGPLSNALDIQLKNPANTNVLLWGDFPDTRLLALWEVRCTPNGLRRPTLAPTPVEGEGITHPPGFCHEHARSANAEAHSGSQLIADRSHRCHQCTDQATEERFGMWWLAALHAWLRRNREEKPTTVNKNSFVAVNAVCRLNFFLAF